MLACAVPRVRKSRVQLIHTSYRVLSRQGCERGSPHPILHAGVSEQEPAPETVQDRQHHCTNEGSGKVVNFKIVEQGTGQK